MKAITLIAALGGLLVALNAQATTDLEAIMNLNTAFRGESNAHNRYALFAEKADKDGYPQVAKLFRAPSRAEEIHRDTRKAAIETLGGTADVFVLDEVTPAPTKENLEAAIKGETYERDTMYPAFRMQAESVQAAPAVRSFQFAVAAEKEHAVLYAEALANLGSNPATDYFVCMVCGNTVTVLPGKKCPVCRNKLNKCEKVI